MTTEQTEISPAPAKLTFATRFLPWIIAAILLLVYLFTLNHWVTLKSLPVVAKIADWDWRSTATAPLHFLLTYPFRWLGESLQLPALNFFSALCAALTLALLARSVALLPHDRTREQRQRDTGTYFLAIPYSWLPPLIAVLVCGFQLTFWEHAVAMTGEMLDLLLFAYVVRCLLEFRISKNENWLTKMALVYGLGVTNNFAMIGFFPFFLVALIWIKGLSFFNFRFVLRMITFGAIGLSLYLLLPIVAAFSGNPDQTFFQTFQANFGYQKSQLYDLPFKQVTTLRMNLFMIALTSLLPLLMIGIRWPSFRGGDVSHASGLITSFMFRLIHLFFLAIGLWVFFDPKFSARGLGFELLPYLTFYYLTALAVGYFLGYALLVFGREPTQTWARSSSLFKLINAAVLAATVLGAVAVPVMLARKNLPIIRATNSDAASQFATSMAEKLPSSKAVVLSDDATRLYLLRAAYAKMGKPSENIFVDTSLLPFPQYHRHLQKIHGKDWPAANPTNRVEDVELIQRLDTLGKTHSLYYLHPSFGYYFERFYTIPHNLVYELKPYPTNRIAALTLSADVLDENRTFWNQFIKTDVPKLASFATNSTEVAVINTFYSRSLNAWGTHLQKAKLLDDAGKAFAAAITLNSNNVVAEINQQFNASLRKGEIRAVKPDEALEKKLGQYRTWESALTWNGPFDEPNFLVQLGESFARGGNLRQSAQYFMRVLELTPKNFSARLGLAKTYIELQRPDETLKLVRELREDPNTALSNTNIAFELLRVESLSHLAKGDFESAEKLVQSAHQKNPKNEAPLGLLTQLYLATGKYTNALETVEKQLRLSPGDPNVLFAKAVLQMQLGQFAQAVVVLDKLLKVQPENNRALLNRAIANLQSGKLDDAKRDYKSLAESEPKTTYQIYYGLAQVAEKQNDKSGTLKNYQIYLKHAPPGTQEFQTVQKRVAELEGKK